VEKLDIDWCESELRARLERVPEKVASGMERYEDVSEYDPVLRSPCRLEE
jgi:hypothetical protein